MDYVKNYFLIHLRYWWLYIAALGALLFGLFIALIVVVRLLAELEVTPGTNLIASSLTAAIIGSLPIIRANHATAKNSGGNVVLKTIINQMVTIGVFYAVMHFSLYWLIIDFRM